jgi:D-alanine-D-alanine ligase-like ATP-grasp enzyme
VTRRFLASSIVSHAVTTGPSGRIARACLAEAGLLLGVGARPYVRRLRADGVASGAPPGRSGLYRRFWEEAASAVGAEVDDLSGGLLRLRRDGSSVLVWESTMPLDNPLVMRIADDKPAAHRRLRAAGVPVADQILCDQADLLKARAFLRENGSVVVKPAASGGGRGVTCGVQTQGELVSAFAFALRHGDRVLVERFALGQEHRLLVLDGQVVGALRRRPPSLLGDGRRNIGQLVAAENARRRAEPAAAGLYPLRLDLDLAFTLRRAGLSMQSVPAAGEQVIVKTAVNENGPQDNEALSPVGPLADVAVAAASALGAELAAVEIITPDPTRPLDEVGGTVVEVNTTPGLHYHYGPVGLDHCRPVAAAILEHLLCREAARARVTA